MNQRKLALWLKTIIITAGVIGIFGYGYFLPVVVGRGYFLERWPELSSAYLPVLIAVSLSAVPCALALISAWHIAAEIGRDNSFSFANAKYMRRIAVYALAESIYIFAANIVLFLLNMSHPGFVILFLLVVVVGIMISVAAAGLAHLIEKAALMREENESII